MSDKYAATFEHVHFAEGRFRRAYKGIWNLPGKRGRKCVIKDMKDSYTWLASDWDTTIEIYDRARTLAKQFNGSIDSSIINVTDTAVYRVGSKEDTATGPSVGEYVVAEDYLDGHFVKWCNNYGYISPDAKRVDIAMPAFVHWSWLYTKGQEMVCDLQGICDVNGSYRLTDPVILSVSRSYGQTDMGIEGMAMFFLNHRCNSICSGWKRPKLHDFSGKIPQRALTACHQLQHQVNNATTFTFELTFPHSTKELITKVLLEIAQGRCQQTE